VYSDVLFMNKLELPETTQVWREASFLTDLDEGLFLRGSRACECVTGKETPHGVGCETL